MYIKTGFKPEQNNVTLFGTHVGVRFEKCHDPVLIGTRRHCLKFKSLICHCQILSSGVQRGMYANVQPCVAQVRQGTVSSKILKLRVRFIKHNPAAQHTTN